MKISKYDENKKLVNNFTDEFLELQNNFTLVYITKVGDFENCSPFLGSKDKKFF